MSQNNFKKNFNNIIKIHRRIVSSLKNSRKIRFFTNPELVKSDKARESITKVYEY